MRKIKIVTGTYGHRKDSTSPVELIDKNSEQIEVRDEEAERLIGLGIAVDAEQAAETVEVPTDIHQEAPDEKMVSGHLNEKALEEYNMQELKTLAKDMGLKTGGSKEELIARIAAIDVEYPVTEQREADDEEPPVLDAVDPE